MKIEQKYWDMAKYEPLAYLEVANKAIELQIEAQSYITAEQARALGAGYAEFQTSDNRWSVCGKGCEYMEVCKPTGHTYKYRAIKQAQPEPSDPLSSNFIQTVPDRCDRIVWRGNYYHLPVKAVTHQAQPEPSDPHAADRIKYDKQVAEGTTGFYLWELQKKDGNWHDVGVPAFTSDCPYRCTDISCHVSKDGEPAIRMLRTEAQELQAKLGNAVEWETPIGYHSRCNFEFDQIRTYTYKTKATIKLDGNMVTPEQAAAEWEAKKETHDCIHIDRGIPAEIENPAFDGLLSNKEEYELRPKAPKQPTWTGSREDVIALLKETGVL